MPREQPRRRWPQAAMSLRQRWAPVFWAAKLQPSPPRAPRTACSSAPPWPMSRATSCAPRRARTSRRRRPAFRLSEPESCVEARSFMLIPSIAPRWPKTFACWIAASRAAPCVSCFRWRVPWGPMRASTVKAACPSDPCRPFARSLRRTACGSLPWVRGLLKFKVSLRVVPSSSRAMSRRSL